MVVIGVACIAAALFAFWIGWHARTVAQELQGNGIETSATVTKVRQMSNTSSIKRWFVTWEFTTMHGEQSRGGTVIGSPATPPEVDDSIEIIYSLDHPRRNRLKEVVSTTQNNWEAWIAGGIFLIAGIALLI